jgi:hypothetical protein
MEGWQVGHVAVDLDSGGLGSRDGLEFVKVHSEKLADGDVVEKIMFFFPTLNCSATWRRGVRGPFSE